MTLPKPRETETGELQPAEAGRPDPLDIERRVHVLVVPEAPYVEVAGTRLRVPEGSSAEREAQRLRRTLAQRLLERRPNADEATWRKLREVLAAAMSSRREMDDDAIQEAIHLVDGL